MAIQETIEISPALPGSQGPVELFQPYSPAYLENPIPFYALARQEQPVFFSPMMHMWVATRYDDIVTVLKDAERFSSRNWLSSSAGLSKETLEILKGTMFTTDSGGLVMADPPFHTRLRRVLTRALSPRLVAQLEDQIRTLTIDLIDAFPAHDPVDFVESFARKLPVQVLCRLVGIPDADGDWIRRSCDEVEVLFIQTVPEDQQRAGAQTYVDLFKYLGDLLKQRSLSPREDLATALQSGGQEASTDELIELVITLLTAGIGTSTHFLPACLLQLIQQGTWRTLNQDPKYIAQVVEEALRLVSPIQGIFRVTTQEVELGGVTVPPGALIYGVLASANRDEQYFPNPDLLDVEREKNAHHMVFGHGIHHCVGAPVVKLEARVALEVLHERFPGLRLAANHPPIRYLPGLLLRGMEHLYIERA